MSQDLTADDLEFIVDAMSAYASKDDRLLLRDRGLYSAKKPKTLTDLEAILQFASKAKEQNRLTEKSRYLTLEMELKKVHRTVLRRIGQTPTQRRLIETQISRNSPGKSPAKPVISSPNRPSSRRPPLPTPSPASTISEDFVDLTDADSPLQPSVNIAFIIQFYLDAMNNVYDLQPDNIPTTLYQINVLNE